MVSIALMIGEIVCQRGFERVNLVFLRKIKTVSVSQIIAFWRSGWIIVAHSEIELLRTSGKP